jgi:hypothetical protein
MKFHSPPPLSVALLATALLATALLATALLATALLAAIVFTPLATAQESRADKEVDKTLVVWAAPTNLSQRGGSALTIQSGDHFDGIVFGERLSRKSMPGSNNYDRTAANQMNWASETADADTLVQIAVVYTSERIQMYRNGQPYADYSAENIDLLGIDNHIAVFGLRHVGAGPGTDRKPGQVHLMRQTGRCGM